jgi:hypothetical protein
MIHAYVWWRRRESDLTGLSKRADLCGAERYTRLHRSLIVVAVLTVPSVGRAPLGVSAVAKP